MEHLATFKFSKHPSEMDDEELEEMADRILDSIEEQLDTDHSGRSAVAPRGRYAHPLECLPGVDTQSA